MTPIARKAKVASTVGRAWTKISLMGNADVKIHAVYFSETDGSYIALQEGNSRDDPDAQDTDYDVYKYTSTTPAVTDTMITPLPITGSLWYYDESVDGGNKLIIKYTAGD